MILPEHTNSVVRVWNDYWSQLGGEQLKATISLVFYAGMRAGIKSKATIAKHASSKKVRKQLQDMLTAEIHAAEVRSMDALARDLEDSHLDEEPEDCR